MNQAIWSAPARADLADIDDYYHDLAPDYARRVGRIALAAAQFLAEHPKAGPSLADGRRKWRVAQTPYVLIYRPVPGGVRILRVQHGSSDWRSGE